MTAAPEPTRGSMPGAWPSELDQDAAVEAPVMPFNFRFGAHLWNAASAVTSYLRDSSHTLYNRFFHSRQQAAASPIAIPPEDDEPSPKRRRLDMREHSDAPYSEPHSYPSSTNSSTNIGDHMDIDGLPKQETSPSQSPVLSPNAAVAAAKKATKLFPNGKRSGPKRAQTQAQAQAVTPPPEHQEKKNRIEQKVDTPKHDWKPLPPPKFNDISEFFDHDDEFCIPGYEGRPLLASLDKINELDVQRHERDRLEKEKIEKERQERLRIEEERLNKTLFPLGLRRPKATLITPLSDEWDQRAEAAPIKSRVEPAKWQGVAHRDGVELSPNDFSRLVSPRTWLNDNAIQATLLQLAIHINDAAGVLPKRSTPKCVALSSQYWSGYRSDPRNKLYPRGLSRTWGVTPQNFLDIDTVLIPVNEHNHWTVIVIRPSRRSIAYVDSFYAEGAEHLQDTQAWLKQFLGSKYVPSEWRTEYYHVPRQTNGYDCGMFVITNSIYLSLGIDPSGYTQSDLPLQRRRIAAMLLHGGFTGPFDLSRL